MDDVLKALAALAILALAYGLFRWVNRMIADAEKGKWKRKYTGYIQQEKAEQRDNKWRGGRR